MLERKDFPQGFQFGAATSSYQIEGHAFGGAGKTHWDSFARVPGAVSDGTDGATACDHYHRFEEDLDLLQGFDAYRFSTSWARVMPEGRGAVNPQGLDYYDRLVDAMLARGLQPFLTLYHWELPDALAQIGGWRHPDIGHWFGDYCDVVLDRIGDRVASVATFNEPWCITWLSHFLGHHAPGMHDIGAAAQSMHRVLVAHGIAMERLRARGQENLGIVLNFEHAQAVDLHHENQTAAARFDAIFNRWFIQAITQGSYPAPALAGLEPHLPAGWQGEMAAIQQPLDWLGVNYYTRQILADDPTAPWPHYRSVPGELPKTDMGWEVYPDGLGQILNRLKDDYIGDLPIYVTENGMARADHITAGKLNDTERSHFIQAHLQEIHRAIETGANVMGYFYWSLLDNYEWAFGYEKRFGLVHVDFETQKRLPKQSYYDYKAAFAKGP